MADPKRGCNPPKRGIRREAALAHRLDQIVVIDLNLSCWEGEPRSGESSEILEIGACLLDPAQGTIAQKDRIRIKPVRSRVSAYCQRKTHLSQAEVDQGVQLMDAFGWLRKVYLGRERTWASWSSDTRQGLETQAKEFGLPFPLSATHLSVASLFALAKGFGQEPNLSQALQHIGLDFEGTPGKAQDQALGVARVLESLTRTWPRRQES